MYQGNILIFKKFFSITYNVHQALYISKYYILILSSKTKNRWTCCLTCKLTLGWITNLVYKQYYVFATLQMPCFKICYLSWRPPKTILQTKWEKSCDSSAIVLHSTCEIYDFWQFLPANACIAACRRGVRTLLAVHSFLVALVLLSISLAQWSVRGSNTSNTLLHLSPLPTARVKAKPKWTPNKVRSKVRRAFS